MLLPIEHNLLLLYKLKIQIGRRNDTKTAKKEQALNICFASESCFAQTIVAKD